MKKINLFLFRIGIGLCFTFVFFYSKLYAGTTISFSNNVSGEFPDSSTYDRFLSSVNHALGDGLKYRMNLFYNMFVTQTQTHIVNQVKTFNFGVNTLIPMREQVMYINKYDEHSLDDLC